MLFPPGRSGSAPLDTLTYPRLVSIKYDGTFVLMYEGELWSRQLKRIPNKGLKEKFHDVLEKLKERRLSLMGELLNPKQDFHGNQSLTRSHDAPVDSLDYFVILFIVTLSILLIINFCILLIK
jgi:hypothetical protein